MFSDDIDHKALYETTSCDFLSSQLRNLVMLHITHSLISMVVADGLAPIRRQVIYSQHNDVGWLVHIRSATGHCVPPVVFCEILKLVIESTAPPARSECASAFLGASINNPFKTDIIRDRPLVCGCGLFGNIPHYELCYYNKHNFSNLETVLHSNKMCAI